MGLCATTLILLILASPLAHASSCSTFSCYQGQAIRCATSEDADYRTCRQRIDRAMAAAKTEDEELEAAFGDVARKMHVTSQHFRQRSSDKTLILKWEEVDVTSQLCMMHW